MRKQKIFSPFSGILIILLIVSATGCEKYGIDMTVKDRLAPVIMSVTPSNNMTSIPVNSRTIVKFSEKIDPSSVNSGTFFIKKGQTAITGSISCNDSSAIFTPSQDLEAGTLYTVTITNAVRDLSGNSMPEAYSWTFTTAAANDNTPPAILTVQPSANATGIAINAIVTVSFSESMDAGTVNISTIVVKQGTSNVTGTVSLSGNQAKFIPSAQLEMQKTYTVIVTTGVKDLAGNTLAANYSWNFTTTNGITGKSFSADVVPVLNLCNTCHTHGWRPSSTASTFHANLLNDGYISTTTPTDGKIYKKLSGSHPSGSTISATQKNTVLTWITEGSKNN